MEIKISTEYIKLEQLLKFANLVSTGGEAKNVIQDSMVSVNGEIEIRRGRKIRSGDVVLFNGEIIEVK